MKLLIAFVSLAVAGSGISGESPSAPLPVLLELFTSEGCSSCPPADVLLQKLDREQPFAGANLIVLSEHVDYWNHLGWADPFSSPLYSQRQRDYAGHLGGEVYTPELVVDGATGFVGSDEPEAEKAVHEAIRHEKLPIQLTAEYMQNKAKVRIRIDGAVDGELYLALAHDAARSHVLRGENAGRGLSHVAVVYSMVKVSKLRGARFDGASFDKEMTVTLRGKATRIVAFVEKSETGRVVALGQARL